MKKKKMKWERYHEKKALKLYKQIKLAWEKDREFTCALNSLLMKLQNNCYLDTGKGLKKASRLNREIFNEHF